MNNELKQLNIKASRKLYYLKKTYGLQNVFNIKKEFKNGKDEKEYVHKINEFLFSSKFKYFRGGKIVSYRKEDYGKEYFFPINRNECKQIKRLIKSHNKKCLEKIILNNELITSEYVIKRFKNVLKKRLLMNTNKKGHYYALKNTNIERSKI